MCPLTILKISMNSILKVVTLLCLFISISMYGLAQSSKPSNKEAYNQRVAKLKQEIALNPDNLNTHQEFIDSISRDSAALTKQYQQWIKEFPTSATVPFAIAKYYDRSESPDIKPYLLKAVANDPKLVEAWQMLAADAQRWGRYAESQEYLKKLVMISPENPEYQFDYAAAFIDNDFPIFVKLGKDLADHFPKSEQAARALYWMGNGSIDTKEKLKYFGLLISKYPSSTYQITSYALQPYFDALLNDNVENALNFAKMMLGGNENEEIWKDYLKQAEQIAKVNVLLSEQKGQQALSVLSGIHLDKWMGFNKTLISMKAKAYSIQGMDSAAYQYLLAIFAQSPTFEINSLIDRYGKALNKDNKRIRLDIWSKIDSLAQPAHPFSLKKSIGIDTVSLKDYLGKVVLLSYWYPGCGPCRAEFPHFETVIKKINSKELSYLTLNIVPSQNAYITPFLKKTGFSFLSLDDPGYRKREKGNLDNRGYAPVNFLIDKKGQLIFSRFNINQSNEADLKLMISMLLER
jgi:peroxiredoxin/cytochrome c-type biogenesis protein CcmH/NrfG